MRPNDNIVTSIEQKYGVRAIQSEANGVYYLEDDDKTHLGILVVRDEKPICIVMTKKQALICSKELKEVCDTVFE